MPEKDFWLWKVRINQHTGLWARRELPKQGDQLVNILQGLTLPDEIMVLNMRSLLTICLVVVQVCVNKIMAHT